MLFYQVFFSFFVFGCVLLSKTDCCVLGFSFECLVFQVVLIILENGFHKNNLASFNLGLISFGYRETFLYMQLVLWY